MPQALTAFLLLSTFLGVSMAATGNRIEFASANHQYVVELSKTLEDKLLVTVFHTAKEAKTLHWSRAVNWETIHPLPIGLNLNEVKALVTNDGNTVVLRDQNTVWEKNGIRIVRREHLEDKLFTPFQADRLTAVTPRGTNRAGISYVADALLDFIFEEQNSYALWFGQTDRWLLISLRDFTDTVVEDPDALNSLNTFAHAKAKDLVLQHQPPPLRKMLGALKDRVVQLVPSLGSPSSRQSMRGEIIAAYLFLTARQHPSDKIYIERLINFPPRRIQESFFPDRRTLDFNLWVSYSERLIGDFLLSRWNGDTNREFRTKEMSLLLPHDTCRYLGSVKIDFAFPIHVPGTNSGQIGVYLTPAHVEPAKWAQADETIAYNILLSFPFTYGNPQPATLGREGQVTIRGLTPGDYRAKIIWDRTGPTGGLWRTNIHTGVAGDYESIHTPTFTVKAGELIQNIHLPVTNLIGGVRTSEPNTSPPLQR
jgi:hypothetical protein